MDPFNFDYIHPLFNIPSIPAGRAGKVAGDLLMLDPPAAIASTAQGLKEASLQQIDIERQWAARNTSDKRYRDRAYELDPLMDKTVVAIATTSESLAHSLGKTEIGQAAQRIHEELFPNGPRAYTQVPFEAQATLVESLLAQLQDKYAADAEMTGVLPLRDYLAAMLPEFKEALQDPKSELSWEDVQQARLMSREALAHVALSILQNYPSNSPEDRAARGRFFAPIQRQVEILASLRSRGRADSELDIEPSAEPNPPQA